MNILVVLTISVILNILGVQPYLSNAGLNIKSLMIFCLVWGMGGAFISLLLSKTMAKWTMGVKIIDPNTMDMNARELVSTVHRYAKAAGLTKMPEVGVYESPEVNAFATGPTRSNSLVAVSRGLINQMDKRSLEGVIGHEVSHIANGDMVTMTLLQGVINAFVMALARVIAFAISNALRSDRNEERGGGLGPLAYMATVFVLEMVFMILGSMVLMWFSRQREFRADAGSAKVAGKDAMLSALKSLQTMTNLNLQVEKQMPAQPAFASMKIAETKRLSITHLFRSHPSLEERIARLERPVGIPYNPPR